MLSSLFHWPQLALGLFVFFHSLLHFIVGSSAHIKKIGAALVQEGGAVMDDDTAE